MNLPEARDADFTWKDFQARTNNELADILGNFVNRTATFAHRVFAGKVPAPGELNKLDRELVSLIPETASKAGAHIESYKFRDALLEIMNLARFANKYFNDNEPWKTSTENPVRCATTIHLALHAVRALAILSEPFIPFASEEMWKLLNLAGKPSGAGWLEAGTLALKTGTPIAKPAILFSKIEDGVIERHLKSLPSATAAGGGAAQLKPVITIDAFRGVDLRVARILSAERVPKSEKLIKLQVSLGNEQRQILAGIAQHYEPAALIGKKIVVVANLAPAKLMGQESQGMLLAASDEHGNLTIVTPSSDIAEGSIVK
jgi:methionyl-tRNA synthetase